MPTALPPIFCQDILLRYETGAALLASLDTVSPTSIRVNPQKHYSAPSADRVEWYDDGFYLASRPKFTLDPCLHGGAYYVQEASSMLVGWMARKLDFRALRVLDLCAAPGGKSTLLASEVGPQGVVVANEPIRGRVGALSENIQKWGTGNVAVTSADSQAFGQSGLSFDVVLVDAPCSGEGMFRKEPLSREQWSTENVALCTARGRRIVAQVWNALAEGGVLIYSTCTLNESEDEQTVSWICQELGAEVIDFEDIPSGVINTGYGLKCLPHLVRGEGFFVAALRKTSSVPFMAGVKTQRLESLNADQVVQCSKWVEGPHRFALGGGKIYAFSEVLLTVVERLRGLGLVYSGVQMGDFIHADLKPAPALALYTGLVGVRPISELSLEEALAYLRMGNLDSSKYALGLTLVSYNGVALGWAKALERRVNNMYPNGWRIYNL
ncbi:MAG: rRNA cytosine-C5-methylase [Mucinivorans sp.]